MNYRKTYSHSKLIRPAAWLLALLCLFLCGCGMFGSESGGTKDPESETASVGESFAVHFIDVGQGDAALILCDGKSMLIDGGDKSASSTVYTYLKKQGLTYLDYVICTHPDADHVGGLSGALEQAQAGTVYCPVDNYDSKAFQNFKTRVEAQGKKLIRPAVDSVFSLGSATVTVLAPRADYTDTNESSIVLRVVYGSTSFLFTGDAEHESESAMCEAGVTLKSTVLKVGHHGSDTSTSIRFLGEVMPQYAVISCGKDNKYGHPTEQTLSRLRQAGVTVYRTDLQGDIICESDGTQVTFRTARNSGATLPPDTTNATAPTEYAFVGNVSSKIYHKLTCSSVPSEQNSVWFLTAEQAESAGYSPCKRCLGKE